MHLRLKVLMTRIPQQLTEANGRHAQQLLKLRLLKSRQCISSTAQFSCPCFSVRIHLTRLIHLLSILLRKTSIVVYTVLCEMVKSWAGGLKWVHRFAVVKYDSCLKVVDVYSFEAEILRMRAALGPVEILDYLSSFLINDNCICLLLVI